MAYADDITVVVERNELERLEILDWFSKGTQFKINKDKCEIIADFEIANCNTKRTSNVLGVNVGDKTEAKEKTLQRLCDLILNSKKYFNKFLSLRGVAKTLMTFVIPKLLHNLRHYPKADKVHVTYRNICQTVLWGPGLKA